MQKFILITGSVMAFIYMIIMNILANSLPLNGLSTGVISEMFHNLFAPAGFAFSIWGFIYLLLLFFVIYQTGLFKVKEGIFEGNFARKVRFYFILSSIANGFWIFAWHYLLIPLSLVFMIIIFISLLKIYDANKEFSPAGFEVLLVRLPFSIYFGWISVAMLANIIVLMVSFGWDPKDQKGILVTAFFIIAGVVLTGYFTLRNRDLAYGIVPVWAYSAILYRHSSQAGFAGEFIIIIVFTVISLIVLTGILLKTFLIVRSDKCS